MHNVITISAVSLTNLPGVFCIGRFVKTCELGGFTRLESTDEYPESPDTIDGGSSKDSVLYSSFGVGGIDSKA